MVPEKYDIVIAVALALFVGVVLPVVLVWMSLPK